MNRDKFKQMNDEERISWIQNLYNDSWTTAKIVKEYDLAKNTVRDTFTRNGYVSDKNKKQYVKSDITNSKDIVESTVKKISHKDNKNMLNESKHENNRNVLNKNEHKNNRNIINLPTDIKTELSKMLNWYKKQQEKEEEKEEIYSWIKKQMQLQEKIIDVPKLEIKKDKLTGEIKTRSFTVYSDILDQFNNFCKDKPYSKQNLLSMALLEYVEKYK
jgi:hypothetical protein